MNALSLIVKREFAAQMKTKSMIWTTLITIVIIIGAGVVYKMFFAGSEDDRPENYVATVAIASETEELTPVLEAGGLEVVPSDKEPAEALESVDDAVAAISGPPDAPTISVDSFDQKIEAIRSIVSVAVTDYIISSQLPDDQAAEIGGQLSGASDLTVENVGDQAEFDGLKYLTGMVTIIVMYMSIVMGISMLSIGIVEEKASRIVEILLATIRPRTLLLGKVLGIGAAILTVIASYLAAGLISASIAGILPSINIASAIPMIIIWILLGYFIYASITGGLAATITRQEEIGAITTPLILLTLIPFYVSLFMIPDQLDSPILQVMTYIPFFSPFIIPMKAAFTEIPLYENLIAMAICLATIPLISIVSGKIYQRSILHTGERKSLMSALRGK